MTRNQLDLYFDERGLDLKTRNLIDDFLNEIDDLKEEIEGINQEHQLDLKMLDEQLDETKAKLESLQLKHKILRYSVADVRALIYETNEKKKYSKKITKCIDHLCELILED